MITSPSTSWILSENYAGLQSQALGLAEAAGLKPELRPLVPRAPWRYVPETLWPAPLAVFPSELLARPWPDLVIGCGGMGSVVGAATGAPVLFAELPGKSRRIGLFLNGLVGDGRIRPFRGRLETWEASPLDDTAEAAAEMCRRLGLPAVEG